MNNEFQTIDEAIYTIDPANITCKKKSPLMGILFLFIGIVFFALNYLVPGIRTDADLSSAMLVLGGAACLIGGIMLLMNVLGKSTVPVYKPTGEKLRRYEFFFESRYRDAVIKCLQSGNFEQLGKIPHTESSSILVIVYKSGNGDILLTQMQEYVPHAHQPVMDTLVFTKSDYIPSPDMACS